MQVFQSIQEFKEYRKSLMSETIAFVPTMGALHDGHLELVKQAKKYANYVIVSIYVNPTQFGINEDLDKYPRTLESDLEKLNALNVNAVFTPSNTDIYPNGVDESTLVIVPTLSEKWCGLSRPQFFKGITKVVLRLFNIVQPTIALFGEKDFQQLQIIKRMVTDLFLDIRIVGIPIIREKNGLAMSSRNQYLTTEQKDEASTIFKSLHAAKNAFDTGTTDSNILKNAIRAHIEKTSIIIDYLAIIDPLTLEEVNIASTDCRIILAGTLSATRLIDNIKL